MKKSEPLCITEKNDELIAKTEIYKEENINLRNIVKKTKDINEGLLNEYKYIIANMLLPKCCDAGIINLESSNYKEISMQTKKAMLAKNPAGRSMESFIDAVNSPTEKMREILEKLKEKEKEFQSKEAELTMRKDELNKIELKLNELTAQCEKKNEEINYYNITQNLSYSLLKAFRYEEQKLIKAKYEYAEIHEHVATDKIIASELPPLNIEDEKLEFEIPDNNIISDNYDFSLEAEDYIENDKEPIEEKQMFSNNSKNYNYFKDLMEKAQILADKYVEEENKNHLAKVKKKKVNLSYEISDNDSDIYSIKVYSAKFKTDLYVVYLDTLDLTKDDFLNRLDILKENASSINLLCADEQIRAKYTTIFNMWCKRNKGIYYSIITPAQLQRVWVWTNKIQLS